MTFSDFVPGYSSGGCCGSSPHSLFSSFTRHRRPHPHYTENALFYKESVLRHISQTLFAKDKQVRRVLFQFEKHLSDIDPEGFRKFQDPLFGCDDQLEIIAGLKIEDDRRGRVTLLPDRDLTGALLLEDEVLTIIDQALLDLLERSVRIRCVRLFVNDHLVRVFTGAA